MAIGSSAAITFRSFRNTDPPALAEIWSKQPRQRGLIHPISTMQLDHALLAKQYFDREGLILAMSEGTPVGFVHAGFGPNEAGTSVSTELGVTCLTMVLPQLQESGLGAELVAQSEAYLRNRGAHVLYAGAIKPLAQFYLGLYGGSELPGILESDLWQQSLYRACGYEPIDRVIVMHCDLGTFRPPVNRQQLQLRRTMQVDYVYEPACGNWWEACAQGFGDRIRFIIRSKTGGPELGTATFWNVEPLASSWGLRVAGLTDLEIAPNERRQGLATFLLGEAFRQLQTHGSSLVEAQTMVHNTAARALYQRLGFTEIDAGTVLRKA